VTDPSTTTMTATATMTHHNGGDLAWDGGNKNNQGTNGEGVPNQCALHPA